MFINELKQKVVDSVNSKEVLEIVKKLISIPSHTDLEGREVDVANYLHEFFQSEGIDCYLQEVVDGRSNVIATLKGSGEGPSMMYNGHIDTVPPLAMENPFTPIEKDGKLYGRGSTDMKAGVATMAYALILLKRLGIKLKGDLIFAGVIDEESSRSSGTYYIVENGPKTDLAIVGEPTNLHPVVAHKGINYYEISFKGVPVHSSVPENGENAISAAAKFIKLIEEELAPKYKNMKHPFLSSPTITMNLIHGGSKGNIGFLTDNNSPIAGTVADTCNVYLDVRYIPYQTSEEITEDIEFYAKKVQEERPRIKTDVKVHFPHPAMEIAPEHKLVKSVNENVVTATGSEKQITGATYWGDSGLLNTLSNIPTLLFGPGDIGCAHSDNEFIDISQIAPAAIIYALTALDICEVADKSKEDF
ncbi:M20 family metallopeptidase [Alkalihalobacillus oceani]|uniref:M20 family metallopeptidase n=1 Tax=Halalkalibacter oceani TaxID=1653776 RepID=A0A9X2DMQ2_9BACI|nr:M20 family metallopeptidase [Halalkalibacter oceani]MCM3712997.1 M20 family metallopeptidase [Halalkalibacter oceani]